MPESFDLYVDRSRSLGEVAKNSADGFALPLMPAEVKDQRPEQNSRRVEEGLIAVAVVVNGELECFQEQMQEPLWFSFGYSHL